MELSPVPPVESFFEGKHPRDSVVWAFATPMELAKSLKKLVLIANFVGTINV